jgi:predicted dehydrogenase
MAEKATGIGLIGLGGQGGEHLRVLLALGQANIVALCDVDEGILGRAEVAARHCGHEPLTSRDYRLLLERSNVDAVYISVPDDLHEKVAVAALEAGKDVFLEKPIAHTPQAAEAILAAAEKNGRILQMGLVYRYAMLYRRMAELAASGEIGRPVMAWCQEFRQPFPDTPWYHSQARTGGTLNEKDCHHFDLFNWMLGSRPKRVFASGSRAVLVPGGRYLIGRESDGAPRYLEYGDNVDHASVVVEYESGAMAQLSLCLFLTPPGWSHHFYDVGVIGSDGRVLKSDAARGVLAVTGGQEGNRREEIEVREPGGPWTFHPGGVLQHVEFLECVRERREPFASGRAGREASLVAFAAERSIREGRVVDLAELETEGRPGR